MMQMDRLVAADFGGIGLGFDEPFPGRRSSPLGTVSSPPCTAAISSTRTMKTPPPFTGRWILTQSVRSPWTSSASTPWSPCASCSNKPAGRARIRDRVAAEKRVGFNPHCQPLTSLQNLGSVINTAVSVFGDEALLLGMDDPALLRRLYSNITDLMLLSLDTFPRTDGRTLPAVFVGDCTVAMISPAQYASCNRDSDRRIAEYAAGIGARFLVHQDSGAPRI